MKLFNERGEFISERLEDQCARVATMVETQLERLADSGATATDLRAYVFTLLLEVSAALEAVLFNREADILTQEGSKEGALDFAGGEEDEKDGA